MRDTKAGDTISDFIRRSRAHLAKIARFVGAVIAIFADRRHRHIKSPISGISDIAAIGVENRQVCRRLNLG